VGALAPAEWPAFLVKATSSWRDWRLILLVARLLHSGDDPDGKPDTKVRSLNERYDALRDQLNATFLDRKALKALRKARLRCRWTPAFAGVPINRFD